MFAARLFLWNGNCREKRQPAGLTHAVWPTVQESRQIRHQG